VDDEKLLESIKALSESQLKTIDGLVKLIDNLSMRVTLMEEYAKVTHDRLSMLEARRP
jgi:hypothetical protein